MSPLDASDEANTPVSAVPRYSQQLQLPYLMPVWEQGSGSNEGRDAENPTSAITGESRPTPTELPAPQAASVSEKPPKSAANDGDDEVNVTYYDATEQGTAPTFEEQPTALDKASADKLLKKQPGDRLSDETKRILSNLPKEISVQDKTQLKDVDLDRNRPARGLPEGEDINFAEGDIGADISIRKRSIDVNYELEKAYNALIRGDTDIAVMVYKDILEVEPENKYALFGLATTYHRLGMLDKARTMYGKLLEIDPYDKQTLNNFFALVAEEAPESAIRYLENLTEENPEFSPAFAQLAQLYLRHGKPQKALKPMQRAASLVPENLVYRYNLAIIHDTLGNKQRAIKLYQQLIRFALQGEDIPASMEDIQERLTLLGSN